MTLDEAHAAYEEARLRDPQKYQFGYLPGDPIADECGDWLWFESAEELFEFLQTIEIAILQLDEPEVTTIRADVEAVVDDQPELSESTIGKLNVAFAGWNEIMWMGTFAELCSGMAKVPCSLRDGYREQRGPWGTEVDEPEASGEEAVSVSHPIEPKEIDGFVRFLTTFGPSNHQPDGDGRG